MNSKSRMFFLELNKIILIYLVKMKMFFNLTSDKNARKNPFIFTNISSRSQVFSRYKNFLKKILNFTA